MQSLKSVACALLLASTLSGCVAAVVPVVAGGAAARHRMRTARARAAPAVAAQAQAERPAPAASTAAALVAQPVTVAPMPADADQAEIGRVYQGKLPSPHPATDDRPAPTAVPPAASTATWAALGHYVAGHMTPTDSVLLARGDQSHPRAVPCAGKPVAVLAPAALVTAARARAEDRVWLDALHTLGVALLTYGPAGKAGANPSDADLPAVATPADLPAMRASAGARYCVVALAGQEPADFPNAYAPDTTPADYRDRWGAGWFLFASR